MMDDCVLHVRVPVRRRRRARGISVVTVFPLERWKWVRQDKQHPSDGMVCASLVTAGYALWPLLPRIDLLPICFRDG